MEGCLLAYYGMDSDWIAYWDGFGITITNSRLYLVTSTSKLTISYASPSNI